MGAARVKHRPRDVLGCGDMLMPGAVGLPGLTGVSTVWRYGKKRGRGVFKRCHISKY